MVYVFNPVSCEVHKYSMQNGWMVQLIDVWEPVDSPISERNVSSWSSEVAATGEMTEALCRGLFASNYSCQETLLCLNNNHV